MVLAKQSASKAKTVALFPKFATEMELCLVGLEIWLSPLSDVCRAGYSYIYCGARDRVVVVPLLLKTGPAWMHCYVRWTSTAAHSICPPFA